MLDKKKTIWVDMGLSFAAIMLSFFFITGKFSYLFSSNDDVMLRSIISGAFTGTPDAHTVYMWYPLSFCLKMLYVAAPQANWYGLFSVGLHYLCWFLIVYRLISRKTKLAGKCKVCLITMLAFFIIDLKYMVFGQYTILAAVTGATACLWFVLAKGDSVKELITDNIVTIILCTLCICIRSDVFLMMLPFAGILGIYKWLAGSGKGQCWRDIVKYLLLAGIICLISGACFITDRLAYQSIEWQEYNRFNSARTSIYDYYGLPEYAPYKEFYHELGVEEDTYYLFLSQNTALSDRITTDVMESIAQKSVEYWQWNRQFYSLYRKTVYPYVTDVIKQELPFLSVLLIAMYLSWLVIAFLANRKSRLFLGGLAGVIVLRLVVWSYLLYHGRYPERVSYSLYVIEIATLLALLFMTFGKEEDGNGEQADKNERQAEEGGKQAGKSYRYAAFLLGMAGLAIFRCYSVTSLYRDEISSYEVGEAVKVYYQEHSENIYLLDGSSLAGYGSFVFNSADWMDNYVYLSGWLSHSPLLKEKLRAWGIESVEEALVAQENVYIMQNNFFATSWITDYYSSKGINVIIDEVDTVLINEQPRFSVLAVNPVR